MISWLTCGQPGGFGWGIEERGYAPLAQLVMETQVGVFQKLGLRPRVCCHNPGGVYFGQMVFHQWQIREDQRHGAINDYITAWKQFIADGGELITYVGYGAPEKNEPCAKYLDRSGIARLIESGHSIAVDSGAVKLPGEFDSDLIALMMTMGATVYVEGVPVSWGARKQWSETPVMFEDTNADAGSFIATGEHRAEKISILTGEGPASDPDHKLSTAVALSRHSITPAVPLYHWLSRNVDVVGRFLA